MTEDDLGFYVLSAPDVLKGNSSVDEVYDAILNEKQYGITRRIPNIPGKASSYSRQHIHEIITLLQLSNLVRVFEERPSARVVLNIAEHETIKLFASESPTDLKFDFSRFDFSRDQVRLQAAWGRYYGSINVSNANSFDTPLGSLVFSTPQDTMLDPLAKEQSGSSEQGSKKELGEMGESLVFQLEKARVGKTHPKLVNKIIALGYQKGLGYDISSVEAAENKEHPDFQRMIEVKSTKRSSKPHFDESSWQDSVTLSRKEWVAAMQYGSAFAIYRVYFTSEGTFVHKISNPRDKEQAGTITIAPLEYSVSFGKGAFDCEYKAEKV